MGIRGDIRFLGQEKPRLFVVGSPESLVGGLIVLGKAVFGYVNLFNTFEGCVVLSEESGAYSFDRANGVIYIVDVPRRITHRRGLAELVADFMEREAGGYQCRPINTVDGSGPPGPGGRGSLRERADVTTWGVTEPLIVKIEARDILVEASVLAG